MNSVLSFEAIGTKWRIETANRVFDSVLEAEVARAIADFDRSFSRFRIDSWVSTIRYKAGRYDLPAYGYELLSFYEELYKATDGLVTPLIGITMEQSGYDASYSFTPSLLTRPPDWDDCIEYDRRSVYLRHSALLDFGAAGKGLLVDIIAELLTDRGVEDYIIDAGGDIKRFSVGGAPITVALENPFNTAEAIGTYPLLNESICASSGAKRSWAEYTHIINPMTLSSSSSISASWVSAASAMVADGIATALFFVPASELKIDRRFEYMVISEPNTVIRSAHFKATLFEGSHR